MRYAQLRAFHFVATYGGFSRAAEALFLTQPAISDQVRKLEDAYDILLFDRVKRQVQLTQKGTELLEITNRMFDAEAQALDYLNEYRALEAGTLRLVVDSAYHVTPILKAFQARYPAIIISLRVGNSEEVTKALQDYSADIGVLGELSAVSKFEVLPLGESPLIAFAAKAGVFGKKVRMSYAELAEAPLVMREQGSKTRQKLEAAAGRALVPSIVAEGREAVREIVAAGNGIGFVSTAEFGQDARLRPISLPSPALLMQESLICIKARRERRLIKAFMQMAATYSASR
ncbi:MAG: LysR family transcriptional regulator [Rhodobacteraceae bacterium]|nr:LysR family transcriptional regulator [Paracoccaceae bacterium]